jgi:WD40 repeat protein
MGVVYKASQISLSRPVALKMILHAEDVTEQRRQRFVREAETLARLHHPHIVQIFEAGLHEGKPFFSMEYIDGGSLDKHLAGTPLPPTTAARLLATLASAMQHAHDAGLIHRDLKPANVLLEEKRTQRRKDARTEEAREEQETGQGLAPTQTPSSSRSSPGDFSSLHELCPKITDFGLAKDLAEQGPTRSGEVMGTPSYMAPEQASGKAHTLDSRADIYALGAILYECLTGRPPFKAATGAETLLQVLTQEPVLPRQLQPSTPRDLETIALKCLQKEPGKRYGSARELADDCEAFLRGEPIKARPVGRLERAWRWAKRRPLIAALMATIVLLLGIGIGGIAWAVGETLRETERALQAEGHAEYERDQALKEKKTAQEQSSLATARAEELQRAWFNSRIPLAEAAWRDGRILPAHERLAEVDRNQRFWDWSYIKRACSGGLFTLRGHTIYVHSLAFSLNRQLLASGDVDGVIKIWDALDGRALLTLNAHRTAVHSLAFSPDSQRLASGGGNGSLKIWDVQSGQLQMHLKEATEILGGIAFSPDGRYVAAASSEKVIRFRDARTGQQLRVLKGHTGVVRNVCFSPDGRKLASASNDKTLRLWDAGTGQSLLTLPGTSTGLSHAAFSPDGKCVVALDGGVEVKVWEASTGRELRSFPVLNTGISGLAISPDGQTLAVAAHDFTLRLWDFADGRERQVLRGHSYITPNVAFSPDGQRVGSVSWDQTVKIWDIRETQPVARLNRGVEVGALSFTGDSRRLATAEPRGDVRVWEISTGKQLLSVPGPATALTFAPDGQWLVTGSRDGALKVLDAATGKEHLGLARHQQAIRGLAVGSGGILVSGSADGAMKVWDLRTGRELQSFRHVGGVNSLALAPDGLLASAGSDGAVRLWDVKQGRELRVLRQHQGGANGVCFSADGRLLASGGFDRVVRLWDPQTGLPLRALWGHAREVKSVCFAGRGARLASTGRDGTVKVWDGLTGQEQLSLQGISDGEEAVAFSPDGTHLAAAGRDGVKLWYGGMPEQELVLRSHVQRVQAVAFSPDNRRLVSGGNDGLVKVWDVETGQELHSFSSGRTTIQIVAFSRDGKHVIATNSSSLRDRPLIWDVQTGQRVPGPLDPFSDGWMTLSPNGQRLAVLHDNLIQIIPVLPPGEEERQARRRWTQLDTNWHEMEAKRYEKAGLWHPVAFHLGWLATERPRDAALLARLAEALARLGRREEALRHATRALLLDSRVKIRLEGPVKP